MAITFLPNDFSGSTWVVVGLNFGQCRLVWRKISFCCLCRRRRCCFCCCCTRWCSCCCHCCHLCCSCVVLVAVSAVVIALVVVVVLVCQLVSRSRKGHLIRLTSTWTPLPLATPGSLIALKFFSLSCCRSCHVGHWGYPSYSVSLPPF